MDVRVINAERRIETKVLTVPQDFVNDQIQVRQDFGWTVQGTSARSFATSITGGGASRQVGHYNVGVGRAWVQNRHLTDITLQRPVTEQTAELQALEERYDELPSQLMPRASALPTMWHRPSAYATNLSKPTKTRGKWGGALFAGGVVLGMVFPPLALIAFAGLVMLGLFLRRYSRERQAFNDGIGAEMRELRSRARTLLSAA
jgi:hypothetical protein